MRLDIESGYRDARTIFDIAVIRMGRSDATREDVEFHKIALRNYQFIDAIVASLDGVDGRELIP